MTATASSPDALHHVHRAEVSRRYVRPSDVCRMTNHSMSSVLRCIYSGELEAYQQNRSWFIPVDAVDRWIRGS